MCLPNLEYQLVNPTTQLALFSFCVGNCTRIMNITWNVYQGSMNSSSNVTKWNPFTQTDHWFFGISHVFIMVNCLEGLFLGRQTKNFTATNQLFLSNSSIKLWRFEVIYRFVNEIGSSSLNFEINQPPMNGSCSIDLSNGTTTTVFTISCLHWFDEDQIKDYSLYSTNSFFFSFFSILFS